MANMPAAFKKLVSCLSKLPGVGSRSAHRMAISLVTGEGSLRDELISALSESAEALRCCSLCGGLTISSKDRCDICTDPGRDDSLICIVESPADIPSIESSCCYRGRYHVLMGRLSPMNKIGIDELRLESLKARLKSEPIREVILALSYDVESEATASLIKDMIGGLNVKLTRPAMGLPSGGGIAYADKLTLARAMKSRDSFS